MLTAARLAILLLLWPATTVAQSRLATIPSGKQIRVATCSGATLDGRFRGVVGDSLTIDSDSMVAAPMPYPPERQTFTRTIAIGCVQSYAVLERYGSAVGRGAMIGAGIGLGLMTVAYLSDRAYENKGGAANMPTIALAIPVAVLCTGAGALLGASGGAEQWSAPQSVTMDVRPMPRGIAAAFVVRF